MAYKRRHATRNNENRRRYLSVLLQEEMIMLRFLHAHVKTNIQVSIVKTVY